VYKEGLKELWLLPVMEADLVFEVYFN